jgi:hypothetical protein
MKGSARTKGTPTAAEQPDDGAASLVKLLDPQAGATVAELAAFWMTDPERRRAWDLVRFRQLGGWFIKAGQPLLAYDVAVEGLGHDPKDVELRQIQGLALARTGAPAKAREILEQLSEEGHADEETLGILARTYKDLALQASKAVDRDASYRKALEIYGNR